MNKEQLRKELEDCWDAALVAYGEPEPLKEAKANFITTRLAAIEKVDGGKPQPITDLPFIESMNFNEKNTILSNSRPITEEGMQDHDLNKLYEWLMDEKRQPAQTYFTEGDARNIAKEIEYRLCKPLDDGQEGKGLDDGWEEELITAEDYLKASVAKSLSIDFTEKDWYVSWWMLLNPHPSFNRILEAMEAYKAALPVADGDKNET